VQVNPVGESDPDFETELDRLRQRWRAITETPEKPRSTMDVIEYGLGDQQRAEVYINRLLCYLLDPTNPHGMAEDFLTVFLDSLPESLQFDEDTYDLQSVRVNQQVPVEDDSSTGYADLVLDVPEEWVLLVELKFSATETRSFTRMHR